MLPVLPILDEWLRGITNPGGWLVAYHGQPVSSVDTAWDTMLRNLGLPMDREWKPYILRHSVATLVRARRADPWELSGFMGHRMPGQTETYAVGENYPSVVSALTSILEEIAQAVPLALHRSCTGDPGR